MSESIKSKVVISESIGSVSLLTMTPKRPDAVLVLGHGAGAGMEHSFMEALVTELGARGVATVRYNFSYMENKRNRPDPAPIAEKTVGAVIQHTHETFAGIPLFAGGKSFGGRMTSQRLSKDSPEFVKGIIFFGFPLHYAGSPSVERAVHLAAVKIPMLFLQGTKDKMAEIDLLTQTCANLPGATLQTLEGADHSFRAGKKDFMVALGEYASAWIKQQIA